MISDRDRIRKIAEEWVHFTGLAVDSQERDSLVRVLDEVDDIIRLSPSGGWMFIEAVRRMNVDASLLSNLAAGPLEDYLIVHGDAEILRLENLAKQDRSLRELLGQTWKNSMSDEVWRRVQLAAKSG
ncbi:DUF6869 domain-containing protein [Stenotrophomonas sp. YAU14D1_LEIMI4_1]|uniref:DUF6869 domain-containing protein n=1 Tax=Stenotrophomonas sp. YAU14D1_LEIMI4_1 TaxID=2072407 RepID=UPI00131F1CB0|nr:hypothetical protein [Stenotrophomonas sp. YAU14D1_LEIMI4_1]